MSLEIFSNNSLDKFISFLEQKDEITRAKYEQMRKSGQVSDIVFRSGWPSQDIQIFPF